MAGFRGWEMFHDPDLSALELGPLREACRILRQHLPAYSLIES